MKRVIVIDYQLFAKDVSTELQLLGYEVIFVTQKNIHDSGLTSIITSLQSDFLFSINFSPEIALICSLCNVKYVSWTVDPLPPSRFVLLDKTNRNNCTVFAHRIEDVEKFKAIGLTKSYQLHLAASRIRIIEKGIFPEYTCDISFVGVTLQKEQEKLWEYLKKCSLSIDLESVRSALFNDYAMIIRNQKVFNESIGEVPEYIKIILAEKSENKVDFSYVSSLINSYYSFLHRVKTVSSIRDITIYGDEYWSKVSNNYKGIAEHEKQLNRIYHSSKLNFDISRFYQKSSINMRIFDSMACGGVVLTEKSESLELLFNENWHYINFLDENYRDVIHNPGKLKGIAMKAKKEIERKHRVEHRVKEILEKM